MTKVNYINRLVTMNELLLKHRTGGPDTFARKLGISRRQLLLDLKELREINIAIGYDKHLQSYYYENETGIGKLFRSEITY